VCIKAVGRNENWSTEDKKNLAVMLKAIADSTQVGTRNNRGIIKNYLEEKGSDWIWDAIGESRPKKTKNAGKTP
jgi:hypothetical protein